MLSPLPWPGHQFVFAMIEDAADFVRILLERCGHRLAVKLEQFRLVVQQVKGRRPSVLKQEDDPRGLRSEVRQPFGQWLQGVDRLLFWRRCPQFIGQQCAERDAGKAAAGLGEKVAT